MLTFVVPFRSKASSKDWNYHCALLNRTIRSILNQTVDNFKVIVVYTDFPEEKIENKNLIWLYFPFQFLTVHEIADYESYAKQYFAKEKYAEYAMDQARRSIYGSQLARELGSSYIMSVDADDLVSNKIAEFVEEHKNIKNSGWYVDRGYIYLDGKNYIYRYPKDINHFCGSTPIINTKLVPISDFKSTNLLDYNFFSSHAWLKYRLKDYYNSILEPLPFYAIVYVLNNQSWMNYGKSFEGNRIKKIAKLLLFGQFTTKKFIEEFTLTRHDSANQGTLRK